MSKRKSKGEDVRRSRTVHETNKWVDAQKGQLFAPGTYVDSHGVIRDSEDHSCVTWHSSPRIRKAYIAETGAEGLSERCERRGIHPSEIVYDEATGAPWCDKCWPIETWRRARDNQEKVQQAVKELFGNN